MATSCYKFEVGQKYRVSYTGTPEKEYSFLVLNRQTTNVYRVEMIGINGFGTTTDHYYRAGQIKTISVARLRNTIVECLCVAEEIAIC